MHHLVLSAFINGVWKWAAQKSGINMSASGLSNVVKWAAATMRHKFVATMSNKSKNYHLWRERNNSIPQCTH